MLDLLEGRLTTESAKEVEAHLAICADCRSLVSALAQVNSSDNAGVEAEADKCAPPERKSALAPGMIVSGRFRLERLLGRGGMGEVWAAKHLITRRDMALKFVHADQGERRWQRVKREALAASRVAHRGILPVADVIELDDGTPLLVMDLLTGRSLGARLKSAGRMSLEQTVAVLLPVTAAVAAAHAESVIHRDLKPDNVFLCDDGEVKVLDFGVAKVTALSDEAGEDNISLTRTGELVGTPHYMAPEQVFGEADVDGRADVWAVGVIAYECLSGERPFQGDSLGKILKAVSTRSVQPIATRISGLPAAVSRLIDRLLSVDRARRPTMAELHTELMALDAGRGQGWHSHRRWTMLSVSVVVAVALAAMLVAGYSYVRSRPRDLAKSVEQSSGQMSDQVTGVMATPATQESAVANQPQPAAAVTARATLQHPTALRRSAGGTRLDEVPATTAATSSAKTPASKLTAPPTATPNRLPGGVIKEVPF